MTAVHTSRGAPHVSAQCEDCDWWDSGDGTTASDNARARAKAHAKGTGHRVHVERCITTYFNRNRVPSEPEDES